ncbi:MULTISPECIES: OprD family porin [unclassified Pseudomonas]|uniref:OprD family porin n=1 Tax=unclassified Pseudomonas TaxID=196821 RepID=UPI00209773B5|nr:MULTISPECIES: OprD family porin [unclassified Pseudomonas]MCO7506836.1 OprD family porin [Pseudomonas sp. VE 267-6A]MCO7532121.1 OprD family porin [Pseudomonas sp. 2]
MSFSRRPLTASAGLCAALAPLLVQADFIQDSKASLEARNFYFNRDFRQHAAPQSQAREWAQGFILRMESGYTEGTLGVGLDALGELGLKLDSSKAHRGTGLLPFGASQEPAHDYSELGLTAKLRLGKSVLKLGTLQPTLPVASINDVRLLPSTYNGSLLTSQDIDGLTLNVGRLEKQNLRDSSSNDQMSYAGVQSSHLDLAGGTYALRPNLALSYYYAQMHDLYRQQYAGLVHDLPLAEGVSLRSDLRYFDTREQGNANLRSAARVDGGRIDNRFFNGMLTLGVGAHKFGLGYQNLSGDGDFAYPGLDPYSVNLVTVNVFTKAETDAWQARYDYNFAALGLPGLSFMTRYVNGNHIQTATVSGGKEWERDTDIAYVVQSGPLKNVSVRLRNATFRSSGGLTSDIDENRLIVGYTLALW